MNEQLKKIRHSSSHVLAQAVLSLRPEAKLAIGPAIEEGFYYDFDLGENTFTEQDLGKIEKKMNEIIKQKQIFEQSEMDAEQAIEHFKKINQPYKVELIEELVKAGEKKVGINKMFDKNGEKFMDLCAGGHAANTAEIGAVKLLRVAGAYWRGDENNTMLQRIYGTAFSEKSELESYLTMLKEAEARDHRKLGKQLGLFVFSDMVGPGMPLYTPKGALIRQTIIDYSEELQSAIGYKRVHTPNVNKGELFRKSGHYDKFYADMLRVTSNYSQEEYFLKPMNCPQHTQIYASEMRSYKDLPIRYSDFANLYRDEKPGELHGLSRLRCFSQDDGHCFCREDQVEEEFEKVLDVIKKAMNTYNMSYWIRLSLSDPEHPEQYIGDKKVWQHSEKVLENILKKNNISYKIAYGEAAFYGPKMDLVAKDAIGREFQISTIQLDFNMPVRFGLTYIDKDGSEKNPVMIHRAIVGSPERFMSILIEHYAGAFPTWLAPVQVAILPVSEQYNEFAAEIEKQLVEKGIRVEVDKANETVGNKIRKTEKQKVPYMLVVGEKEKESSKLTVRKRGSRDMVEFENNEFVSLVMDEIKNRA